MDKQRLLEFALAGARVRVRELDAERARIMALFPKVFGSGVRGSGALGRGKKPMAKAEARPAIKHHSQRPEMRRAARLRMLKYWRTWHANRAKKTA